MSTDDCDTLWHQTLGYGRLPSAPKLGYLTDAQNNRVERIRVARMIWRGWHRQAFLEEPRTQFDFPEMEVNGRLTKPYVKFNVCKLVTTTLSDLLLGEEPLLRIEDELAQKALDDLKSRSDLHRVFYDATKTSSWAAEAMVEVVRWQGQVYIQDLPPDEVFPIGPRQPDGQYAQYTRFATAALPDKTKLLLQSTYSPGLIERACYRLDGQGVKGDKVDLALWAAATGGAGGGTGGGAGGGLDKEATGIAWNTIIWMANELDEGKPTCDYDGLIELQDELNAKQTQIARVIAKHADPKLAAPEAVADPNGNLTANQNVYFYRTKDDIPSYITWNAELASAIEDRDFTLQAFCIAAETSQGLLGIEKGAAPDSARKLRLQATKTLARVSRKATFVRPFIRTALDTALQLVNAGSRVKVMGGAVAGGVGAAVDLRDGLPVDELDQAQTISMLTANKATMSVERGVRLQVQDPVAAQEEIDLLKKEAAEAAPTVQLGGIVGEPGEHDQTQPGAAVPQVPPAAGVAA